MGENERKAAAENREAMAELIDAQREFFESGDYQSAVYAVKLCLQFGMAIPSWLETEVDAAMQFYYKKGGAAKRGSKGNLARTRSARLDKIRYRVVERERDRGLTKSGAIERASQLLAGKPARGTEREINDSYDRVASRYRGKRRKSGPKPRHKFGARSSPSLTD